VDIEEKKIDGAKKSYFVLKPKADKGATFYVPTWNENANLKCSQYTL
jgi:RNA polymerase-interacting CarD/CdnL/TRCF family regulator